MKFTVAALAVALGGVASAQTFNSFPATLTCFTSDTDTASINNADLKDVVVNGPRSLLEKVASNMATGAACQRLKDPLYQTWTSGVGSFTFVYQRSTDTYTFCGGCDDHLSFIIQGEFSILSTNTALVRVLERAASLNLPNWYLATGALSQTIWNHVSSLPPDTGIHDYDLVYHDASNLSYEAEDAVIQAGKALFADIPVEVEIRNQARVHLWYEKRFSLRCPAHESVEAGIDSWISTSAMVGVRLEKDGSWSLYAPRGLSDFYNMVVRPNPVLGKKEAFEKKVARWRSIWKNIEVEAWEEKR
ncbi:hypothetical protein HJFPF1_07471 [Paramyrothecium foliicola]|nr:hypothetical protein HJFPF1_07471 [Paramyrothecium foliicola]